MIEYSYRMNICSGDFSSLIFSTRLSSYLGNTRWNEQEDRATYVHMIPLILNLRRIEICYGNEEFRQNDCSIMTDKWCEVLLQCNIHFSSNCSLQQNLNFGRSRNSLCSRFIYFYCLSLRRTSLEADYIHAKKTYVQLCTSRELEDQMGNDCTIHNIP